MDGGLDPLMTAYLRHINQQATQDRLMAAPQ
jgi:hypothetical protein